MKMIFNMMSGKKHAFQIGNLDEDFCSRVRTLLNNESEGFITAFTQVDKVITKQAVLKVSEIESVTFE
jgi:hypothetical protein